MDNLAVISKRTTVLVEFGSTMSIWVDEGGLIRGDDSHHSRLNKESKHTVER